MKASRIVVQVLAWVVWFGLVMAIPTYALVIHFADNPSGVSNDDGLKAMRPILGFVAFIQALFILLIRFVAMRAVYRWKGWLSLHSWGGLVVWVIVTFILLSLAQSIATYGLTLFFQAGDFRDFYSFASAGLVLTILLIPIWRDLERPGDESAAPPIESAESG